MWDVISDLYYGAIRPNVRTFRAGTEAARLSDELSENEDWLMANLKGSAKKRLLNLLNCQSELEALLFNDNFRRGFLLGARLVMEVSCAREEEETA